MYTRKDYMNHVCDHRQYYAQFVTLAVRSVVTNAIGLKVLQSSKDEHLNDIPLAKWDSIARVCETDMRRSLKESKDFYSLGSGVCIAKEAARQLLDEQETVV